MLHYLRIAVTALSLTACVLLIALWVRSYRIYDDLSGNFRNGVLSLGSMRGRMPLTYQADRNLPRGWSWWHDEPDKDQIKALSEINHISGFNTYGRPEFVGILLPHWFLVVLTAIVGVVAWPRGSYRFSLRTLLIVTALIAVGLGIVVVSS